MSMIGKVVVVRDNMAGVLVGELTEFDAAAKTAVLTNARKIHWWVGAAAVEGLAVRGCGEGSHITPSVECIAICDVVQVCLCSAEGAACLLGWPEWSP